MPDNPGDTKLGSLEAEVDEARARLARTIDKLRDPATHEAVKAEVMERVNGYKDQLLARAQEKKDELLDAARTKAREKGQGLVEDLKQRAMNNPTAVAPDRRWDRLASL